MYWGGDRCSHNGHNWEAKWWTQGEEPPGTSGVWKDLGLAKRIASDNPKTSALPLKFALEQNYPNPFNPITYITYAIPKTLFVTLKIYNTEGKEIVTLVHTKQSAGYYSVAFDGSKFESGVYIYRIEAGKYSAVRKMLLVK